MRKFAIVFLTVTVLLLTVTTIFLFSTTPQEKPIPSASTSALPAATVKSQVLLLGWIPYWDQDKAFQTFKTHYELFNFISFFWYQLDTKGAIKPYTQTRQDQTMIDFAHARQVKVLAVVANLPDYTEGGDWDPNRVRIDIKTPEARTKHINELIKLLATHDFDGINIDYEALKAADREQFTAFIKELGLALHQKGKLLGVAIHPKTSEDNPKEDNGSHAQDWAALAPFIDQFYLMTYSEHYLGSAPGANASIEWVARVLAYAVDTVKVPKEKIFMGIPFYGQAWARTSDGGFRGVNSDITFENAKALSDRYQAPFSWDESSKSPYLSYVKNGEERVMWFEDNQSLEAKLALREKFQIPNIAIWRLGGEDSRVWTTLQTLK